MVLANTLAGCFIVTGSTDGYQLVDAGKSSSSDGVACAEGATCVAVECVATTDCDAGEICCLSAATGGSIRSACQATACTGAQFCKSDLECGDSGATCASQQCVVGGVSLTLQACGVLPTCSAI